MIQLHDSGALRAHCAAHRFDPAAGRRVARAVLRHGRSFEEALAASSQPVPASWSAGLGRDLLERVAREDSELDGSTKLRWRTARGATLESVLLRIASGRTTLCLSIQSRCPVSCAFCASGGPGPVPRLGLDELLEQVVRARRLLRAEERALRNLVFMGAGEPLLEEALLFAALERLTDPAGFGFAPRQITVSTVGLPAGMERLARRFPGVRQALSLHAARPEVRQRLIPLARRHGPAELREAVRRVGEITGGQVLVEVLLLAGLTDRPEDEEALARWLEGLPVLLNLIPYNRAAGADPALLPTPLAACEALAQRFRARGVPTTLRRSLGPDIDAACGQLAAEGVPP